MHAGKWEKKSLQGTELRGKTLGIIGPRQDRHGSGAAGESLRHGDCRRTIPLFRPAWRKSKASAWRKLEDVYAAADYLTLHVGLTPQTSGMINADSIKTMKKGVRIVNCARGELVDEAALAQALKQGLVAARRWMFLPEEPLKNSPLTALDNVILTPHIGGSTHEAQEAVGFQIAQQVKEYLKHGVIQNAVNVPSVSHDEYAEMQPYVVLAERLGSFLAQVSDGMLEEISLRYSGHIAESKTDLIRNAAIKGI